MNIRANWSAPTRSAPAEAIKRPPQPSTETKCRVAGRQMRVNAPQREHTISIRRKATGGLGKLLDEWLDRLCEIMQCSRLDLRLDHNPALALREYDPATGLFTPDANDPYFLVYRTAHDHHIKTNVSGDGAQRSDTAERVHRRILDQNRGLRPKKKSRPIQSRGFDNRDHSFQRTKRPWPKRKFGQ